MKPLCQIYINIFHFPECCTENLTDCVRLITNCGNYSREDIGEKKKEREGRKVIELTVLNVIYIIACVLMVFFWGMSIDREEEMRKIAKGLWYFFLVIVWICILIK